MRDKKIIPEKVTVMGAGKSGIAAARLLTEMGRKVFISDICDEEKLEFIMATNSVAHIDHESGGHSSRVLENELVILSPGIDPETPVVRKARKKNITVWSEIELGFRVCSGRCIAVTGSNGKSTTTSMIQNILGEAGIISVAAGNIGVPFCSVVNNLDRDSVAVLEVSSFQLETIDGFRPDVAVVLNLNKNHLDRYECEEDYYNAKKNIIKNMKKEDVLILNSDDELLSEWGKEIDGSVNVVYYGNGRNGDNYVWLENDYIYGIINREKERLCPIDSIKVKGIHNHLNACAASAAALKAGADVRSIINGLSVFKGLEHRCEFVGELNGVRYYNDSKATTIESVVAALSSFERNVYLIAGGKDKGCDYMIAVEALRRHVKEVLLIGEAADMILERWHEVVPAVKTGSLYEAVEIAADRAGHGDVVLLSPGCSSFDMFRNFEERGRKFKEIVNNLKKRMEKKHG